ncbi:helix-turn-helix transcriptional regulator [Nesterenkonia sp. Act20]|uniref:helix-turn-helix domain-containing protein n=1 Tax=Nesterenkonia sp. Act20 TaxID=1483432 RepID=UPI001C450258|nr:helix-turn-helix transcriptional regulator [Nesterenkonia sp. Act20]
MSTKKTPLPDDQVPGESKLLRRCYEESRHTVPELAELTGLSTATIHIAMQGFRYRQGEVRRAVPHPDTLARLASALRISPGQLREVNRTDVLDMLTEASEDQLTVAEHKARAVGYDALERQVLAVFSTDELREEIARREP